MLSWIFLYFYKHTSNDSPPNFANLYLIWLYSGKNDSSAVEGCRSCYSLTTAALTCVSR